MLRICNGAVVSCALDDPSVRLRHSDPSSWRIHATAVPSRVNWTLRASRRLLEYEAKVPVFDVAISGSELRVVATGDQQAIVTYLAGNAIQSAAVSCKY